MHQLVIKEWQQHVLTVSSLVDSLRNKSHITALKRLKKVFGGSRGLNDDNKKLVEDILRSSQREEPVVQQVVNAPMWGAPRPNYFHWGQQQQFLSNLQDLHMGYVIIVSSLDIMLGIAQHKDLVLNTLTLNQLDPLKEDEGEADHLGTLQEAHLFYQEEGEGEEEDIESCESISSRLMYNVDEKCF